MLLETLKSRNWSCFHGYQNQLSPSSQTCLYYNFELPFSHCWTPDLVHCSNEHYGYQNYRTRASAWLPWSWHVPRYFNWSEFDFGTKHKESLQVTADTTLKTFDSPDWPCLPCLLLAHHSAGSNLYFGLESSASMAHSLVMMRLAEYGCKFNLHFVDYWHFRRLLIIMLTLRLFEKSSAITCYKDLFCRTERHFLAPVGQIVPNGKSHWHSLISYQACWSRSFDSWLRR